jgi:hypothetical protein
MSKNKLKTVFYTKNLNIQKIIAKRYKNVPFYRDKMQCAVVGGNLLRSENIQSLLNKNRWKWTKVFTVGRGTPHLVRGGVCGSKRGGGGGWGTPRRVGTPAGASTPGPARVLPVQGNLCPQQAVGIRISILSSTVPYYILPLQGLLQTDLILLDGVRSIRYLYLYWMNQLFSRKNYSYLWNKQICLDECWTNSL